MYKVNDSTLNKRDKGRLEKAVNTFYNFGRGAQSLKDFIETAEIKGKKITNNVYKANWKYYKKLDVQKQNEYIERIEKGRTHYLLLGNDDLLEIPKLLFNIFDTEDITEYSELHQECWR